MQQLYRYHTLPRYIKFHFARVRLIMYINFLVYLLRFVGLFLTSFLSISAKLLAVSVVLMYSIGLVIIRSRVRFKGEGVSSEGQFICSHLRCEFWYSFQERSRSNMIYKNLFLNRCKINM